LSNKNKLVFVKQKDHDGDEKAVCLTFDFTCEKTRNHIRQFTSSLIFSLNEYENFVRESTETSQK
jgi:hypothetical protein